MSENLIKLNRIFHKTNKNYEQILVSTSSLKKVENVFWLFNVQYGWIQNELIGRKLEKEKKPFSVRSSFSPTLSQTVPYLLVAYMQKWVKTERRANPLPSELDWLWRHQTISEGARTEQIFSPRLRFNYLRLLFLFSLTTSFRLHSHYMGTVNNGELFEDITEIIITVAPYKWLLEESLFVPS